MSSEPELMIQFVDENDEDHTFGFNWYDIPIIPPIGSEIEVSTSRDTNGNYIFSDGRPNRICVIGTVVKHKFYFQEYGHSSQSNRKKVFVLVFLHVEYDEDRGYADPNKQDQKE